MPDSSRKNSDQGGDRLTCDDVLIPLRVAELAPQLVSEVPAWASNSFPYPNEVDRSDFRGALWLDSQNGDGEGDFIQSWELHEVIATGCIRLGDMHKWIRYFRNKAAIVQEDAMRCSDSIEYATKSKAATDGWLALCEGILDDVLALRRNCQQP